MKAETARKFAAHLTYLAYDYRSSIYREENDYDPYHDAELIARELKEIAKKEGEEDPNG